MSVWRTKTRLLVYVNVIHLIAYVLIYTIHSYNLYDVYPLILSCPNFSEVGQVLY